MSDQPSIRERIATNSRLTSAAFTTLLVATQLTAVAAATTPNGVIGIPGP